MDVRKRCLAAPVETLLNIQPPCPNSSHRDTQQQVDLWLIVVLLPLSGRVAAKDQRLWSVDNKVQRLRGPARLAMQDYP